MRERRLQTLFSVLALCAALIAIPAHAGEVAKADLDILGLGLEVLRDPITTPVGVPATVQTKFGGEMNERAPAAPGMSALAELTGPGIVTPITLAATPGHRFTLPPLQEKGEYSLQNIRLAGPAGEFLQQAIPSYASVTVTDVLKTEVRVRQLTPEELRERGITVDLRNYDVYEYTVIFGVEDEFVEIPYPVIVDKRTHQVQKIDQDNKYRLPPLQQKRPPRFTPPVIEEFEFSPGGGNENDSDPEPPGAAGPRIPAAIILPNGFGVLHQFFAVILQVSNTSPDDKIRLDNIAATISMPPQMRTSKVVPATSLGQPVPIYDEKTNTTYLVAGARGTAEWTLEALKAGTHNIDVTVEADYQQEGQPQFRMRGKASTAIVVNDPRFQITFSHPDTVRTDEPYTAYAFITNLSAQRQHVRLEMAQEIPKCSDGGTVNNICRTEGDDVVELDIEPGDMIPVPYKLTSRITGNVFAGAGSANDEAIGVSVKLSMGVSQSGIPLSPATLVMPYYARYLSADFIAANMQLLGLGYSVATAPLTKHTARFPRVIKSDVFQRAQEIARAGQRIFATRDARETNNPEENRDAFFHLALDLLGNVERVDHANIAPDLFEWDELRRKEVSGRRAAKAMAAELKTQGFHNGRTPQQFVDDFASAAAHRTPFLLAYVHGAEVAGQARPYALELTGIDTQVELDVPAEAASGWVRTMPYAELTTLDAGSEKGELAMVGRWSESIRVRVIPQASSFTLHLVYPDTATGAHLRSDINITGATPGLEVKIDVARGSRTLIVSGASGTPSVSNVQAPPLRVLGAAQDMHLNEHGRLVSVLFNRPLKLADAEKLRDQFALTINVPKAGYTSTRRNPADPAKPIQIPAAALQQDARLINVTFDKALSINANYVIAVEQIRDLVNASTFAANDIVPRVDNNAPGGILTGRVLLGDNTAVPGAEVILEGGGPQQIEVAEADGRFMFEFVARDIANSIDGTYILEARANGRATKVQGAVRLIGEVHNVNLVFLGRGRATGQVRYADGEVLKKTEVVIGSTLFGHFRNGITNDQGFYEIGDLPVGPLTFSVVDPDGRPTFAANAIRFAGEVINQDLVIERTPFPGTGTVRVTVRRADTGDVVEGAHVGVYTQGYGLTDGNSDANGFIEFRKVPAGLVSIIASHFGISRDTPGIEVDMKADEILERTILIAVPPPSNPGYAILEGVVFRDDPTAPGDRSKDVAVPGAIITIANLPPVTADANGAYTYPDLPPAVASEISPMLVFDPATGRKAWFDLPGLFGGQTARFSPILSSGNPEGEATIRVRLTSATGEPVTDYRVIEPGFPPDVFTHIGGGVYERSGIRVPMKVAIVAVPTNPNGPYGDQMTSGKGRVDFAGQTAVINMRLPGHGTIISKLELRQPQEACPTDQPCYAPAFGKVAISYSVWDEIEQATKAKTVVKEADQGTQLNTFTKVPARQETGVYTDRHPAGFDSEVVGLAYEGDTRIVTLRMETLGDVSGRVFAHDRQTPISGAVVRLENGRVIYGTQLTKPDGSFRFAGIQANLSFRVVAEYTRDGIYRTGYADGKTSLSGGGVGNLLVVMREQSNIEGMVVDADDNPVPLARYSLAELAWPNTKYGTEQEPLQADINGKFYLTNVFTGPFRITASDPVVQEQRGHYQADLRFEGDTSQLAIKVKIGSNGLGTVVVRVVDSTTGNAPVQNAEVRLYRDGSSFDLGSTDEHGIVTFAKLPAGTRYSVSAYSKSAGRAGSSSEFALAKDGTVPVEVVLSFLGRVAGILTDPESKPEANLPSKGDPVQVDSPGVSQRTSTDGDGKFEVRGVPEGTFKIFAYDLESGRMAFGPPGLFISKVQQEVPNLHLELEKTATLTVNAYLPTDSGTQGELAPLVGVLVEATDYYRESQGQSLEFPRMITRYGYKITATELGGEHRKVVAHGSWPAGVFAKTHNVTFPSTGSAIVHVKDNLGNPVADAKVNLNGVTMYTPTNGTVELKNIPFGWVSVHAAKNSLGASDGKDLRSRSIPLEFTLNLGATIDVTGTVHAEEGVNLPSPGTRVVLTIHSRLVANAQRRLETFTAADGTYRFTGVPVGDTTLHLIYYGPDDTTIGWESIPHLIVPNTQTTEYVVTAKKLDATPPRVLKIVPNANENNVSPGANIVITFSEQLDAAFLTKQYLQLRANDSSGLAQYDIIPSVRPDKTFEVTLKPIQQTGERYPLKSNMLYRISVVQGLEDTTGNAMLATVGSSFTTVNYTEPAVVRVSPDAADALASATFYIKFNKQVDVESLAPEYGGVIRFEEITKFGGTVVRTFTLAPPYIDPADPTVIVAAITGDTIEESKFYRLTVDKIRDKQVPANVQKEIKVVEFFSFDETAPVARIVSPVAEGEKLVSGVLYRATVEVLDEDTTVEADDVEVVHWLDADGKFLTSRNTKPWAYEFEAPATDVERTYTLQVSARDLSGNPSPSARSHTWTVIPNAAPSDVTLTATPASLYPTQKVGSVITFNDEGVKVTVALRLVGQKNNGDPLTLELDSKQVTRPNTTTPWASVSFNNTLPLDLKPGTAQLIARVTDVTKTGEKSVDLEILDDTSKPEVVSSLPKAETRYKHKDPYTVELQVRDVQTGVNANSVTLSIAGSAVAAAEITKTFDAATGIHTFRHSTTAGARNADTRIPIVTTVADAKGNVTTTTTEVIFERVDDVEVPVAAWVTPLDGAPIPFGDLMTGWETTLRVHATDKDAVTKVRFESDRFLAAVTPLTTANAGAGFYQAKVKFKPWTAEDPMRPFVITAYVEDAEPDHTVVLPITVDPIVADKLVQSDNSISSVTVAEYADKNVVIRATGTDFSINVPVRIKNLLVLDGAKVTAFEETKLDLKLTERLFVDADSSMDVTDRGYLGGHRTGQPSTNKNNEDTGRTIGGTTIGGATASGTASDASHAGVGGEEEDNNTNATYGSITDPLDFGAGGSGTASSSAGGNGGGVLYIRGDAPGTAKLIIAGALRADGGTGQGRSGAGAGGSINLEARMLITGPKTAITVNGGDDDANDNVSTGGGAGRIALRVTERLDMANRAVALQTRGGRNGTNDASNYIDGGAGTIFLHAPGATNGELIVSAFDKDVPASVGKVRGTPLSGPLVFDAITIGRRALARFDAAYTVPDPSAFTVDPTALVLTPEDLPTITVNNATPPSGGQVTQSTNVVVTFVGASPAGVTRTKTVLGVQPTPAYQTFGTSPATTPATTETLKAPQTATVGPTTLKVLVTDRAGRTAETTLPYSIVENAAPVITDFTVTPAAEVYANGRIDVSITATDDIAVSNIVLTSSHGTPLSGAWGGTAVTPRTRTYHWNIAKDIPSGTEITLTATATDSFPATHSRTYKLKVRKDEGQPLATIVKPQANQVIQEGATPTFDLEVTASDAEVAVKEVKATFEGQPHVLTFVSGTMYRKTGVPVPDVEGTENVAKTVTFTITDYDNNVRTESVTFFVKPLNDPSAPDLSWLCSSPNAMYPAGTTVPLRVTALPRKDPVTNITNNTSKVELSINGGADVLATRMTGTDNWTYDFAIPAGATPGSVYTVRVKATSASSSTSTITGSFLVVGGSAPLYVPINTKSFINADDTAYTPETTVVVGNGGELVITGPRTLKNLVVLDGGKVVQQHLDPGKADLLTVERLYVACGGQINVNGLGYAKNTTYPGAGVADDASAGSHIGRGGMWKRAGGGVFGNIYRPAEGGGGAHYTGTISTGTPSAGGGSVRITATQSASLDGAISADGNAPGTHGSGAGGSVWIITPTLQGSGSIQATTAGHSSHAGGGGGAIALEYGTVSAKLLERLNAKGGAITNSDLHEGSAGSIYLKSSASQFGELIVDNSGVATVNHSVTELPSFGRVPVASVSGNVVTLAGARFLPNWLVGREVGVVEADNTIRGPWTISAVAHDAKTFTGHFDVPTQDAFAYDGYLVSSVNGIGGRKFVAARYVAASNRWEYDDGSTFFTFIPASGDAAFASFTKDTTRITSVTKFDCSTGCAPLNGLATGELVSGEIAPNSAGGTNNTNQLMHIGVADDAELFLRPDGRFRGLTVATGPASITLAGTPTLQAGDVLQGVYRFDKVKLANARVLTEDVVVITNPIVKDAASSLVSANAAAPVVTPGSITIASGLHGPVLSGTAGAITDTETPIDVLVKNETRNVVPQTIVWDRVWGVLTSVRGAGVTVERVFNSHPAADSFGVYSASAFNTISEGTLTFGVSQSNQEIAVGLAPANTTGNYNEPGTNAFRLLGNGTYQVWANGAAVSGKTGNYSASTGFRIEKTATTLRWFIDGAPIHEVTTGVPASLRLDLSFQSALSGAVHSLRLESTAGGSAYGVTAANGSFRIPIRGAAAGDVLAITASDRHTFPLSSAATQVATMPAGYGVQSVTFAQAEITGGRTSTGTVTLASPAGVDGAIVPLARSNALVTVPASVNFLPGATTANFTITTQPAAADTDVVVTATWGGVPVTGTFRLVRDNGAPVVTITVPAADAQYTEGATAGINVEATIVDADSGVASASATLDTTTIALTKNTAKGPNVWTGKFNTPFVDGNENVTKTITVTGLDNLGNPGVATVDVIVKPISDANPPGLTWSCFTSGGLYAVGDTVRLRVKATAPNATSNVQRVEFFVTGPDGVTTPFLATALANDEYEYLYTVPAVADGAAFSVRTLATTAGGATAELTRTFNAVAGAMKITTTTTIAANDTTYENQTVVVTAGTTTIIGAHTFRRLIVNAGATVTQVANDTTTGLNLQVTEGVYVACTGAIDVSNRGYPAATTYPNTTPAGAYSGGSHMGVGGLHDQPLGATYGSVYRPMEAGAAGTRSARGGGIFRLRTAKLVNDGAIRSNGDSQNYEGTAGGSIWITADTFDGTGVVEARGGGGDRSGGGGAIAVEYTTATETALANINAYGGTRTVIGGGGTVYLKSSTETYGTLRVDNNTRFDGPTDLPSLGSGTAQSTSAGAVLATGRATNVPPYFAGHWVRVSTAGGTVKGTWRIKTVDGLSVTLEPNGTESIDVQPGDKWQGLYRFDTVVLRRTTLTSQDPIETTDYVIDGGTTVVTSVHAANVRVKNGGVLTHPGNSRLDVNASDSVTVETGGTIDVSGKGFPTNTTHPGERNIGAYSSGSHIGVGGLHDAPTAATYGSVYRPNEGGGGGYRHGHGGGVARIRTATLTVDGAIRSNGTTIEGYEAGAGGSVYITTSAIGGAGAIEARGWNAHRSGGGGAIAIEYGTSTGTILSNLNAAGGSAFVAGGAGSIYLKSPSSTYGTLIVDNGTSNTVAEANLPSFGKGLAVTGTAGAKLVTNRAADVRPYFGGHWVRITAPDGTVRGTWRVKSIEGKSVTFEPNGSEVIDLQPGDAYQGVYRFDSVTQRNTELRSDDPIEADAHDLYGYVRSTKIRTNSMTVRSGAIVDHAPDSTLEIQVTGELKIEANARIDVSERGYATNTTHPNVPPMGAFSGGSHIGHGGLHDLPLAATFGSVYFPREAGGGGYRDGRGGGVLRIIAGSIVNEGAIRANGTNANYEGGAGGSIWITTGILNGAGTIEANGGTGDRTGGGGAIAVEYATATPATLENLRAVTANTRTRGGAGSIYLKSATATYGHLIIDAKGVNGQSTNLPSLGFGTAQAGSAGTTIVTNLAANIQPYFVGHWVEVTNAAGTKSGRIALLDGKKMTLVAETGETIDVQPGDKWQGVYRFDSALFRTSKVSSADPVRTTTPVDAGSTVIDINDGAPLFPAAKRATIVVESTATADVVIGGEGAVTDANAPIRLQVTNVRTGVVTAFVNAAANGSFRIPVTGMPGDTFTITATDSHAAALTSEPLTVNGSIVAWTQPALEISPSAIKAGENATAVVRLSQPAAKPTEVTLQRSSNIVTIPASLTFAAGENFKQFSVVTSAGNTGSVTITATHGISSSAPLNVVANESSTLSAISLSATAIEGGVSVNGTVYLASAAPAGGAVVMLYSSSDRAMVQQSVTVPEGATEASFTIATMKVGAITDTIISGTWGESKTATLQLHPCASMTIASRPSGTAVASVWVEDDVPAGAVATGDASFDATQVATGSTALHFAAPASAQLRTWSFTGAAPLAVAPTDSLVLYALVNPCNLPKQLLVTWKSGTTEYRASWGEVRTGVSADLATRGAIPAGGEWVRLEVLASTIGIGAATSLDALSVQAYGGEVWLDRIGVTACSMPTASAPPADAAEVIWFDDALPTGAVVDPPTSTRNNWTWSSVQVAGGSQSHVDGPQSGLHEHAFYNATQRLALRQGDVLFTYVYLDPCNPPKSVMLSFYDGQWRRAYWGEQAFPGDWGDDGTQTRLRMGPLPELGKWVRLEVPVSMMGLDDRTLSGAAYVLVDGRAWFDRVGKYSRVNLATGKKITQSTQYIHYAGTIAIDGALNNYTHTTDSTDPYLELDLGSVQPIEHIQIWNRQDCCHIRFSNHWVMVSDKPFSSTSTAISQADGASKYHYNGSTTNLLMYTLPVHRTGRYVRVQIQGFNALHLAEIQVWAPAATKLVNVSGGAVASSSSFLDLVSSPETGVDGHINNTHNTGASAFRSGIEPEPWWQVDLGKVTSISTIDLLSRMGGAATDLTDFYVFVSDAPISGAVADVLAQPNVSALYYGTPAFTMHSLYVNRTGRYVRIQKRGSGELSFAEVKVWSQNRALGALARPADVQ